MRGTRQPTGPETKYAMPVSHSHQFLCVPLRPSTTTVRRLGLAGSVTSHTSWVVAPLGRNRYHLPFTPCGKTLPLQTRTICAPPPSSPPSDEPGICDMYLGCA